MNEDAMECRLILERVIRDSNALDTESLCILADRLVWKVVVDVVVVDHGGNIIDACIFGAISSLLYARRPEFTISGQDVVVHSVEERQPVPLAIQHVPFAVSFVVFDKDGDDNSGGVVVVDPGRVEEIASSGGLTISMNASGEICGLHKGGGCALDPSLILQCVKFAEKRVKELSKLLNDVMQNQKTHHPLATLQPILVAPEPTAVLTKKQRLNDDNVIPGNNILQRRQGGQWNAVPAMDQSPPPPPPLDNAQGLTKLNKKRANNLQSDAMEVEGDDFIPIVPDKPTLQEKINSSSTNSNAVPSKENRSAKNPTTKPTRKKSSKTDSSSSSSESGDDLVSAILDKYKIKGKKKKAVKPRR